MFCIVYFSTIHHFPATPPPVPPLPLHSASRTEVSAYNAAVDLHNAQLTSNKRLFQKRDTVVRQMDKLYAIAGWKVTPRNENQRGQLRFPIGSRVECNVSETTPGNLWESGTVTDRNTFMYTIHLDDDDKRICCYEDNNLWIRKLPVVWDGDWHLGNRLKFDVTTSEIERHNMTIGSNFVNVSVSIKNK